MSFNAAPKKFAILQTQISRHLMYQHEVILYETSFHEGILKVYTYFSALFYITINLTHLCDAL